MNGPPRAIKKIVVKKLSDRVDFEDPTPPESFSLLKMTFEVSVEVSRPSILSFNNASLCKSPEG